MKKTLYIIITIIAASCTSTKKMDTTGSAGQEKTGTLDSAMEALVEDQPQARHPKFKLENMNHLL